MKLFVFSIICAFLEGSHQNPINLWTLLPHILVVEVNGSADQLPLSCLESQENLTRRDIKDQDIIWMKNGIKEEQKGNSYFVQLEESLGGANYTCHSNDGSLLNHTEILIQDLENKRRILKKSDKVGDYLRCSAQNYSGDFQCSWDWHTTRVGSVAFINAHRDSDNSVTQCSVDASGQHWTCSSSQSNFICSVDDSGYKIMCKDKHHCPYAEETQRISITIFVRTKDYLVENYSKRFFLSEIVKPDKVSVSKVNTTTIQWTYPSSWSSPFSYFPLTFQIAQLKGRCKKCNSPCTASKATKTLTVDSPEICQFAVKHKAKAICIRAKDALCDSQWSEWSHLRLSRDKKNRRLHNRKRA